MRSRDGSLARQMQPAPGVEPRPAAALLLLYPHDNELWFPLTVRSSALPLHRGEVSLPGGGVDSGDAGVVGAALREAQEEIGVYPDAVEILGTLAAFYIPPSNFQLTPVVGFTPMPFDIRANPAEVEAVFSVALNQLLDPATVETEEWEHRNLRLQAPFFALHGYKVWGATALLLSELVARLRRLTPHE